MNAKKHDARYKTLKSSPLSLNSSENYQSESTSIYNTMMKSKNQKNYCAYKVTNKKSAVPNVYKFLKYINRRMLEKMHKSQCQSLLLSKCFEDPNQDKNSKVYNTFLQIMIQFMGDCEVTKFKDEFMNEAMNCYSNNKTKVDDLVRTYENLNKQNADKPFFGEPMVSRNAKLSASSRDSTLLASSAINSISKSKGHAKILSKTRVHAGTFAKYMHSSNTPVTSRVHKKKKAKMPSSKLITSQYNKSRGHLKKKHNDFGSNHSSKILKGHNRSDTQSSRNKYFKKAKSISQQDALTLANDKRKTMCINILDFVVKSSENEPKVIPSPSLSGARQDYFPSNRSKKFSKDKRSNSATFNLSRQHKIAIHHNTNESNLLESTIEKCNEGEPSEGNDLAVPQEIRASKKQCLSGIAPHGGSNERLNNEERLNVLSDFNISKFNANSTCKKQEKSVDLSMKSSRISYYHDHSLLTNKLIDSNKLSKYLTGFIGKKDFRPTEERELDKCTFNPQVFSQHRRYKAIKAKISSNIKKDQSDSAIKEITYTDQAIGYKATPVRTGKQYQNRGKSLGVSLFKIENRFISSSSSK